MNWLALIFAGLFEIGWPLGLKMAQQDGSKALGLFLAVLFMAISGGLLFYAQKTIPMGTAYVVWTGIGAVGTFLVGILFFNDPKDIGRCVGALLIVSGVITLKYYS